MKKETSNQFTEGLVSDLNPINTPNTVLTDALNATIITYDGNEHSLQNDRGNYPLENCRLKPNYIPVGLKEYGNILYIVSYNPLNNHVEIGSYPSPMQVESSSDLDTNLKLDSVIDSIIEDSNYSYLVEKCKTHVWTSDNEEESKLYPGDEYKISVTDNSLYKYETLEFLIIDENRQKYNITDLVNADGEWHPVAWQIPGWLAAQYRLATFDDFIMSIRSTEIPQLKSENIVNGIINLNFQVKFSDKLLLSVSEDESIKTDLTILLKVNINNVLEETKEISLNDSSLLDWKENSKILWSNFELSFEDLKFGDTITIDAFPVLNINIGDNVKKIYYDSFTESVSIPLNSVGSYSDFSLADKLWKFYIDPEQQNKQLYLEYDVRGPIITKSLIQLYYRVKDINNKILSEWKSLNGYSGITEQGFGIINFDSNFKPEEIYILDFTFYKNDASQKEFEHLPYYSRMVIASELFFEFVDQYSNFNEISFDKWSSLYKNAIKFNDIELESSKHGISPGVQSNYKWNSSGDLVTSKGYVLNDEYLKQLWNKNNLEASIIPESKLNDVLSTSIEFVRYYPGSEDIKITPKINILEGKLWSDIINPKISLTPTGGKSIDLDFNSTTNTIDYRLSVKYGSKKIYDYEIKQEGEQIKYRNVEDVPLLWLDIESNNEDGDSNQAVDFRLLDCGNITRKNDVYEVNFKSIDNVNEIIHQYVSEGCDLPNKISQELVSALGTSDVGIVGVGFEANTFVGEFQLRHGSDKKKTFKDTSTTSTLFTYLIIRNTVGFDDYVVFIPIKDDGFWNNDVQSGMTNEQGWLVNTDKMSSIRSKLSTSASDFLNNLVICDDKTSLIKGSYLTINIDNEEVPLPLCSINSYLPKIVVWNYNNYNLLKEADRNTLINQLGKNTCGELLSGKTNELPQVDLYTSEIPNTSVSVEEIFDNTDNIVKNINSKSITDTILSTNLKDQIISRTNQRGVYWTGNYSSNADLIKLLNTNYANSSSDKLWANDTNLLDINAYLTNDADKCIFGKVHNKLTFTWT